MQRTAVDQGWEPLMWQLEPPRQQHSSVFPSFFQEEGSLVESVVVEELSGPSGSFVWGENSGSLIFPMWRG